MNVRRQIKRHSRARRLGRLLVVCAGYSAGGLLPVAIRGVGATQQPGEYFYRGDHLSHHRDTVTCPSPRAVPLAHADEICAPG